VAPKADTHQQQRRTPAGTGRCGEAALAVQPIGHPHGLAQAVDHPQLAKRVARDDHVETVGAKVDGGQQVAILQCGRSRGGMRHGRMLAEGAVCSSPRGLHMLEEGVRQGCALHLPNQRQQPQQQQAIRGMAGWVRWQGTP